MWEITDTTDSVYMIMSSLRDKVIRKYTKIRDALDHRGYAIIASNKRLWLGRVGVYYSRKEIETNTVLRYEEVRLKAPHDMHRLIVERTLTELDRLDLEQI